MQQVIESLKLHFDSLENQMRCFSAHGVQVEGWFKGELLLALDSIRKRGLIEKFDREVNRPKCVDFKVDYNGEHWIELKHWLVGEQRGTKWTASYYFTNGILKDVDKLLSIDGSVRRWLLVFTTLNPGSDAWESGLGRFNERFAPRSLSSLTDPADYPQCYFLGLLRVNDLAPTTKSGGGLADTAKVMNLGRV